jgi:hypothetical protein
MERDTYQIPYRTVRVVVLDAADCALLFACVGEDGRRFWFLPGGEENRASFRGRQRGESCARKPGSPSTCC